MCYHSAKLHKTVFHFLQPLHPHFHCLTLRQSQHYCPQPTESLAGIVRPILVESRTIQHFLPEQLVDAPVEVSFRIVCYYLHVHMTIQKRKRKKRNDDQFFADHILTVRLCVKSISVANHGIYNQLTIFTVHFVSESSN